MAKALIHRYFDIVAPKIKENTLQRGRIATSIRKFRKQQASRPVGKQLNTRKVIHAKIRKHVLEARAAEKVRASAHKPISILAKSPAAQRTIHTGLNIARKGRLTSPEKPSVSVTKMSPKKPRGRKAGLLATHVQTVSPSSGKRTVKRNLKVLGRAMTSHTKAKRRTKGYSATQSFSYHT